MSVNVLTCPACGRRALRRRVGPLTVAVRGRQRTLTGVPRLVCSSCGEEFFDREANSVIEVQLKLRRRRGAA